MSTEPRTPVRKPSFVVTGLLVATVVGLWLLVWGELLVMVPRSKKTFDEFGLKLPAVTEAVVGLGQWAAGNLLLSLPAVLGGAVVFGGLIGAFRHRPRWSTLVTVLAAVVLALLVAANVVIVGALAQPAIKLQEGLAK